MSRRKLRSLFFEFRNDFPYFFDFAIWNFMARPCVARPWLDDNGLWTMENNGEFANRLAVALLIDLPWREERRQAVGQWCIRLSRAAKMWTEMVLVVFCGEVSVCERSLFTLLYSSKIDSALLKWNDVNFCCCARSDMPASADCVYIKFSDVDSVPRLV